MVGRKSIFFTFIGIFVVAIMMIFVSIYTHIYYKDTVPQTRLKFNIAEDFIEGFENDFLPRGFYSIGYSALAGMAGVTAPFRMSDAIPYVNSNINDEVLAFQEAMINGSLNGSYRCGSPSCGLLNITSLENKTFVDWMDNLTGIVWDSMKLNMSYDINYFNLTQNASDGPWHVSALLNMDYNITDASNDMLWVRDNITIHARIPIEGITDPFVNYQSNGTIIHKIRRFDQPAVMTVENVTRMLDEALFVDDPHSFSFLQRFGANQCSGEVDPSECCGITSLVKSEELNETFWRHEAAYTTRNYVDVWYYIPKCKGPELFSVEGITELDEYRPFRLSNYHISLLNILPNQTTLRNDAENMPCGSEESSTFLC